jgi:threonine aldolase
MPQTIDLRSDTVTRPTPEMRVAIAQAEVGDDVFGEGPILGEDPTVNELQGTIAETLGKEAALFVPSGTMSNQIGLRVHCRPGDEFICEAGSHIFNYEQGGYAQLSGLCARPLEGQFGVLRLEQFQNGLIRADNEHLVRTRLVCLENTHNRGGGRVLPLESIEAISQWARQNRLATHLDGARLFNAVVASGVPAREWARHFDTVSVCFSKGLGAPVGSALCGPRDLIAQARRHRKLFGGGMRQVGILAAGALYALQHHVDRLAEDHANARLLGAAIRQLDGLTLRPDEIDTNIVIFAVDPALGSAAHFASRLAAHGVKMIAFGPQLIRAVTHLDVTRRDIDRASEVLTEVVQECSAGAHQRSELDSAYV